MSDMTPAAYRVTANEPETADTRTLTMEPLSGERLSYQAGQFTMLYAFGGGEVPISISGDPTPGQPLVQTVRALGAGTQSICRLESGEQIGVRGPFGRGWPDLSELEGDLLLIAGGLGLAPLRPALYEALRRPANRGRVTLLYGGREPEQLLFREELDRWRASREIDCELIVDIAGANWHGSVGVVPSLIERTAIDPATTSALVCGPEVMMRYAADALLARGLAASRIHASLERNMRCAVGHCGHCQWGASFICRDGPVLEWSVIGPRLGVREL